MLYCWLAAYAFSPHSSREWSVVLAIASPVLLVGMFFTDGRGGWVAAVVGAAYVALRYGIRPLLVAAAFVVALTLVATYQTESAFRKQVDMTFDPTRLNYQSEFATSAGIDDGSRVEIWQHEAPRVIDAPLFGTGLYHRGGLSGLWTTGSHNYWLQMFLETGIVGGVLVLSVFWKMWQAAGSRWPEAAGVGIGARGALLAAFLGGMSGEYFYGGKPLLALFLVVAPALSLPFEAQTRVAPSNTALGKPSLRAA
jgi:O-antigen ligase